MDSVVAEKLEAIVSLGMLNTRMKDFYDIWFLSQTFPFEAEALGGALRATFERRKTGLHSDGLKALLVELSGDVAMRTQWRAFLRKSSLTAPDNFVIVNDIIREFLFSRTAATHPESLTPGSWPPGGPWHRREEPGPQSEKA
jgi:hypothetical protein